MCVCMNRSRESRFCLYVIWRWHCCMLRRFPFPRMYIHQSACTYRSMISFSKDIPSAYTRRHLTFLCKGWCISFSRHLQRCTRATSSAMLADMLTLLSTRSCHAIVWVWASVAALLWRRTDRPRCKPTHVPQGKRALKRLPQRRERITESRTNTFWHWKRLLTSSTASRDITSIDRKKAGFAKAKKLHYSHRCVKIHTHALGFMQQTSYPRTAYTDI